MASTTTPSSAWRALVPGVTVASVGTTLALGLHRLLPTVSALTVAVVLGVLVGRAIPSAAHEGLSCVTRRCLRTGVVLLGLQLSLEQITALGLGSVLAVVATVAIAFGGTIALGRLIGAPRGLTLLVATGFSICGASAVAAMDTVTRSAKEEVATAVTLVTLYGSLAIAVVPPVGAWLGLDPTALGAWAGISVHEVAQVVAAASPAGATAVGVAVVVKLTRVVLLAPIVAGVSVVERRRAPAVEGRRPPLVPLFVLGFLSMSALRTFGAVPEAVLAAGDTTTTVLFAAALFGLGCAVRPGSLLRSGRRGLLLGGLSTLLVGGVGLGALALAGVA